LLKPGPWGDPPGAVPPPGAEGPHLYPESQEGSQRRGIVNTQHAMLDILPCLYPYLESMLYVTIWKMLYIAVWRTYCVLQPKGYVVCSNLEATLCFAICRIYCMLQSRRYVTVTIWRIQCVLQSDTMLFCPGLGGCVIKLGK
jgi:hypothetical protein